ncbi:hypothetical protein ACFLY9_02520 [Patescibacteria group bacterium]
MLFILGSWIKLIEAVAKPEKIDSYDSRLNAFTGIFFRNSISVFISLIIGIINQGPISLIFYGVFYSLIIFLAPITIDRWFGLVDWIFVLIEIFAIVYATSIGSFVSGEWLGLEPNWKSFINYWKKNWKNLFFKGKVSLIFVLKEKKRQIIFGLFALVVLLILGAFLEIAG